MAATPRTILDHLTSLLVATASGLRPSSYRQPLELQPVGGSDRLFELQYTRGRNSRGIFGDGRTTLDLDVVIRVAYARLGGDAGGGSRKQVNAAAGEDAILIQDALENAQNIDTLNTDIREVRMTSGLAKEKDGKLNETWSSRYRVDAWFPWPG